MLHTASQLKAIEKVENEFTENINDFKISNIDHDSKNVIFDLECQTCLFVEEKSNWKAFNRRKNKCKKCPKESKAVLTVGDFKKILEDHGYKLTGDESLYKNTKTMMDVKYSNGRKGRYSYNSFKNIIRSPDNPPVVQRLTTRYVRDFFKKNGFDLIGEYKNTKTPIECRCIKCDGISFIRYENMRQNSRKCEKCTGAKNRRPWDNIVASFEKEKMTVLSDISGYKNNSSKMRIKCNICNFVTETSWKQFSRKVGAKRCPMCRLTMNK